MAVALTNANTVSHAVVDQAVTIDADGNVAVTADGDIHNEAKSRTSVYIDGSLGSSVSLAFDKADVRTTVDGRITARGQTTLGTANLSVPLSKVDSDADAFNLVNHGLKDGQELLYVARPPSGTDPLDPIGGLVDGQTYRVVVIDANHFQLVAGEAIRLDASQVDPASTQTLSRRQVIDFAPGTQLDADGDRITFASPHGLSEGEQVEYFVGTHDGAAVGGLENQGWYFVHVVDAHTIQLMTDAVDDPAGTGPSVVFGGVTFRVLNLSAPARTATEITFDPTGQTVGSAAAVEAAEDKIGFEADHNFTTGQKVRYSSGGGTPIGGLADGDYYVIRVDRNVLKLARTAADAEAGVAVNLSGGAAGGNHSLRATHRHFLVHEEPALSFNPTTAVTSDSLGGKITFASEHGLQTGDAVVYRTDPSITKDTAITSVSRLNLADVVLTFNPKGKTVEDLPAVDPATDMLQLDPVHDFVSGQRVTYSTGGGTAIGGLVDGGTYFVITDPQLPDRLRLATRNSADPAANPDPVTVAGIDYYVLNLDASAATGSAHKLTGSAVDLDDDLLVITGHGFQTGQKVRYISGGGVTVSSDLTDGGDAYVIRIDANRLKLATSRANASSGIGVALRTGATGGAHSLASTVAITLFDASRTTPVVNSAAETIELPVGHGLQVGDVVRYESVDGEPIPGLTSGAEYRLVSVSGNLVQLGEKTGPATPKDLGAGATVGLYPHALVPVTTAAGLTDPVTFNPTLQPTVDADADSLWMPGHRFRAGERVTYLTSGETPIGGLVDGHDYFVILGADGATVQFADASNPANDPTNPATLIAVDLSGGGATGFQGFERAARAVRGDTPIEGLTPGEIYYVARVDEFTIRLVRSPINAADPLPIDLSLTPAQVAGAATLTHQLKAEAEDRGIKVAAKLKAENNAIADAGVGGFPTVSDFIAGDIAQDHKTVKALAKGAKGFMGIQGSAVPFSISASVGLNVVDHEVVARVGSNAVLTSDRDVAVSSAIEEKALVNVEGTVTTENAPDGKKVAVGAAVAIGSYANTAQAFVDGGARVDARDAVAVQSDVTYPILIDNLPFHPAGSSSPTPTRGASPTRWRRYWAAPAG